MSHPSTLAVLFLLAFVASGTSGCSTKRSLTITSCPSGADVWVAGEKRGTTPLELPFVHYGDVEVRVEKPGYESVASVVHVPTQIDGYPLIDLPFELTVRSRRFYWQTNLEKLSREPSEAEVRDVLDRANAFRERTRKEATPEAILQDATARAPAPKRSQMPAPTGPPPIVRSYRTP